MPQTIPIDNLNALAWELRSSDPVRAALLAAEAGALSVDNGEVYRHGMAQSLRTIALTAFSSGDFQQAIEQGQRGLELFRELGDRHGELVTLQTVALSYYRRGEYRVALESFHETLQIARELGERRFEAIILNNMGLVQGSLGDFPASLESHTASLGIVETLQDRPLEAMVTINIGLLHSRLGENQQAIEQYARGIAIGREAGDRATVAKALHNTGVCHERLGDLDTALTLHLESLAIWEELGQPEHAANIYHNIGSIYLDRGNPEKALEYTLRGRQDSSASDLPGRAFSSLAQLGAIAIAMKQPDESLERLTEALAIARRNEVPAEQAEAYRLLCDACLLAGDAHTAIAHLKEYQRIRDELFNRQMEDRLRTLRISREVAIAQKQAEIERLRNVELKQAFDNLKAAQTQLVQSEKMASLGELTAGIAHQINNPVNYITASLGPARRNIAQMHSLVEATLIEIPFPRAEQLRSQYEFDQIVAETEALFAAMKQGASRTAQIVTALRQFTRFEQGDRKPVDLHEGLDATIDLMNARLGDRIELVREYGEIPMVDCYPGEVNQVFMILLNNAVQAIDGAGEIRITTSKRDGWVSIAISDSGCGMSPEVQQKIFEPFFTTRDVGEGSGLGLSIAWGIIEKHGGRIEVASAAGKGSEIVVMLPV